MLRISPSESELKTNTLSPSTVEQAAQEFRLNGAVIVENIIDQDLIEHVRKTFMKDYDRYLDGLDHEDALKVGEKRLMITVDLKPPFDDPHLFANSFLMPILNATLDEGFVIDSFGVVCSLPHAPAQRRHSDGGALFSSSGLDRVLPMSAVTVAIPLLEMNEYYGTTSLWLGSHRDGISAPTGHSVEPVVPQGACVMWDFRLKHAGMPNRSKTARPLLYLTYCRSWWIDHLNFAKQKQTPLRVDRQSLERLPERHRRLLARAQEF